MIPVTLVGTCIGKICKLYLARVGPGGWMPETITIYNHDDNSPVTFKFNYFNPQAQFSGHIKMKGKKKKNIWFWVSK
jgi:hypothetical protein